MVTSPPLSPSPLKERGKKIKREASPLLDSFCGVVGGNRWGDKKERLFISF